jgi:hypothetical protein
MVNFALLRGLSVTVRWHQHKNIQKVTWRSPDSKICKQICHILVGRLHCTNVCDLRSIKGAEIGLAHF